MSFVTAEGRKAQAVSDDRAQALREPVLAFIAENAPVSPSDLLAQFSADPERIVRAAMWLLLDSNDVRIDVDRKLVLDSPSIAPDFTKDEWATITVALRHTHGGNFPLAEKAQQAWAATDEG